MADHRGFSAHSVRISVEFGLSNAETYVNMVIIPAGVYHGFTDVTDHIEYVSIRSDPNHVLPAGYISPVIKAGK